MFEPQFFLDISLVYNNCIYKTYQKRRIIDFVVTDLRRKHIVDFYYRVRLTITTSRHPRPREIRL